MVLAVRGLQAGEFHHHHELMWALTQSALRATAASAERVFIMPIRKIYEYVCEDNREFADPATGATRLRIKER